MEKQDTPALVVDGYTIVWTMADGGSVAERLYGNRHIYEVVISPPDASQELHANYVHPSAVPRASLAREIQRLGSLRGHYSREFLHRVICALQRQAA